jgi:hypothetical protein
VERRATAPLLPLAHKAFSPIPSTM